MASTSNIHNSTVGVVNQGGNVQIDNIHVHANNPQPEVNESEFDLPRLIDTFHGREKEFKTLEKMFFKQKKNKIVVHGLPGYGKTELCKQFAQRCLDVKIMDRVFWIAAEKKDELDKYSACLKTIYKKYEIQRCIFVFDNALNRRSICDYEPSNNDKHKMLVTSHIEDWGHDVKTLQMKPLTSKPVTQIFKTILQKKYRKEDHSLYLELGRTVDNVPLGVQIVAGYVRQGIQRLGNSFQLIDCVEEMKQSKHKIINDTFSKDNPNPYKNSIYGALTTSLNKMKEEDDIQRRELAVTVLYVCAFLNPEKIQCDDFIEILPIKELIGDKNSKLELKSAIRLLINFSFVNYCDTEVDTLNIHRLVQSFLRQYLKSCDLEDKKCYNACAYAMISVFGFLKNGDLSTEQECINFLKKVFQGSNWSGTEFIYDYNLFYRAAAWNRIEIYKLLLQHADINKLNDNGHKVIYSVARAWNVEAVELLIERGVDVNHKDGANRTSMDALLSELEFNGPANILNEMMPLMSTLVVMLERGALFNKNILNEEMEFLLLSSAAKMNNLNVLQSLINLGLNVNSRGRTQRCDNSSVLYNAVWGGNFESIQMLISHGADINAVNDLDRIAVDEFVQYVIFENRNIDNKELREILNLLICQHALNTNFRSWKLLHWAAKRAHAELVTVLIETYNCEVNEHDHLGDTPLHWLLWCINEDYNKEEVVQTVWTLIRCGASLNIKDRLGVTPLNLLKMQSKKLGEHFNSLVPLLPSASASPTPTTNTVPGCKNCNIL